METLKSIVLMIDADNTQLSKIENGLPTGASWSSAPTGTGRRKR